MKQALLRQWKGTRWLKWFKKKRTAAIIGDDDASTIAKLHQTIDPNIEKISDKNHVKKNLSNCFYELKVTYPTLTE